MTRKTTGGSLSAADDAMLEKIQRATFQYFAVNQEPATGLVYDRSSLFSPASVAACGFSLSAHCVAAERGWITREQSAAYCHKVMSTLLMAPEGAEPEGTGSYRGFFYHFLDPKTATRACDPKFWPQLMHWFPRPPTRISVELSTIDTTLLMAGVLFARQYFDRAVPRERSIRAIADRLYRRVEWDWMLTPDNLLRMGWQPETGLLAAKFSGFTEGLLLYILAIGSPTHPVPKSAWEAQLSQVNAELFYGETFVKMGDFPMFGYQYPLCWLPLQGIKDQLNRRLGFDYFVNAQRAARAQHRYAIANPGGWRGYGPINWCLTACDGPADGKLEIDGIQRHFFTYGVRGPGGPDDGTIAPTAAAASLPFAPDIVLATLRDWTTNRPELMTPTGFVDAFNMTIDPDKPSGWLDPEQLGIDQGPIVLMIENFRSGLLWHYASKDRYIRAGLRRAGFKGGWLTARKPI